MLSWLHRGRPSFVEGDHILPMHRFDDTVPNNGMILSITLCFDAVLDPERIHSALVRLLQIGEWRKLGGRIRQSSSGRLEIHIPQSFSEERPAVRYYHEEFETSIQNHALASQLPRARNAGFTVVGDMATSGAITEAPGAPRKLADYLSRDEPQMSLRINSFKDATLVSLNFLHNLTDATGIGTILKAWSDVLAGKEDQVPRKIGTFNDSLARLARVEAQEPLLFAEKELKGLQWVYFVLGLLWSSFMGKRQQRTFYVPKSVITKLRQDAIAHLAANGFPVEAALNNDSNKPFLSEGDVLISWLSKHAAVDLPPSPELPATIINVYDTRARIPFAFSTAEMNGKEPQYVGNATFFGYLHTTTGMVASSSLGDLGAAIRTQLVKQTTAKQIQARVARESKILDASKGDPTFFLDSTSSIIFFTNWSKSRLYEIVDFSAAVVDPAATSEAGLPSYIHTLPLHTPIPPFSLFQICGRDREGGYWGDGFMSAQAWKYLDDDLKSMSRHE